jgi:hypothetical protein
VDSTDAISHGLLAVTSPSEILSFSQQAGSAGSSSRLNSTAPVGRLIDHFVLIYTPGPVTPPPRPCRLSIAQSLHSPSEADPVLGRQDAEAGAGLEPASELEPLPAAGRAAPEHCFRGGRSSGYWVGARHMPVFFLMACPSCFESCRETISSCTANFLWPNATRRGEFLARTPGTR